MYIVRFFLERDHLVVTAYEPLEGLYLEPAGSPEGLYHFVLPQAGSVHFLLFPRNEITESKSMNLWDLCALPSPPPPRLLTCN